MRPVGGEGRPTPGSRYYAGYNAGFVEDVLKHLNVAMSEVVFDPWNGAGTTTEVAARAGRPTLGIDVNPAMVMVAKSKLLTGENGPSYIPIRNDILSHAMERNRESPETEPLDAWFNSTTARHLRSIEVSIRAVLGPTDEVNFLGNDTFNAIAPVTASFYVILFETVRSFLSRYTGSNPTWFKRGSDDNRVYIAPQDIASRFRTVASRHHAPLRQKRVLPAEPQRDLGPYSIVLGKSTALPPDLTDIGACISSPPYCTRIDYPVLTRPELAVLGIGAGASFRQLRDDSIGTTTMTETDLEPQSAWGVTANQFLSKVKAHPSKASDTYYYRYFLQYFTMMERSLSELRRVLKPAAPCGLVVQDSYYKDIHNDLAGSLSEMAAAAGWAYEERHDYRVSTTMAAAHPHARNYRSDFSATESLLVLRS